jgi:hypothetical protein
MIVASLRGHQSFDAASSPSRTGRPAREIWSRVSIRGSAKRPPRLIPRAGSTAPETMVCTVAKTPLRTSACYLALNQAPKAVDYWTEELDWIGDKRLSKIPKWLRPKLACLSPFELDSSVQVYARQSKVISRWLSTG